MGTADGAQVELTVFGSIGVFVVYPRTTNEPVKFV